MEILEPWKVDTEVPTATRIANAMVFSDVCKPHTEIYPWIGLTDPASIRHLNCSTCLGLMKLDPRGGHFSQIDMVDAFKLKLSEAGVGMSPPSCACTWCRPVGPRHVD